MCCFAAAGVAAQRRDVTPQRIMTPPALRDLDDPSMIQDHGQAGWSQPG
jgi:hypothetical protein